MVDYRVLYLTLFHAITDAIDQLEHCNYGNAKELLVQAQLNAEEQYLSQEESPSCS